MTKRADSASQTVSPDEKKIKKTSSAKKSTEASDLVLPSTTFTLTITAEELRNAREKALERAQRTMKADGFRQGKVPLLIVEQRLGAAGLMDLMLEETLSPAYSKAIAEKKIEPLTEPEIKPLSIKMGEDWTLEVSVAVLPEVDTSSTEKLVTELTKKNELWTAEQKDVPEVKLKQDRLQAILTALLEEVKVPVPELLLRKETERQLHELSHQLEHLNLTVDDYLKKINKSMEELQQDYATRTLGTLQVEIFLANLIRAAKFKVEPKEIEEVLRARMENAPADKKPQVSQQDVEYIHSALLKQKAIDHLLTIGKSSV